MEIIKVKGGKYQLLNHNGELMFQGTKDQCYLSMQNMISYEWEYMDRIRNGYHSHEKPNNESESLVDETN